MLVPTATVTKYHRLTGLHQHRFITLHFWRSEVWNQFHWVKNQGAWLHFLEASGEAPVSRGQIPWLVATPTSASVINLLSLPSHLFWLWHSCLFLIRCLWLPWAHPAHPEQSPHLKILNPICRVPPAMEGHIFTSSRDEDVDISGGMGTVGESSFCLPHFLKWKLLLYFSLRFHQPVQIPPRKV